MVSSNSSSISIFKLLYDDIFRVERLLLLVKKNRLIIKLNDFKTRVKFEMSSENTKTGLLYTYIYMIFFL